MTIRSLVLVCLVAGCSQGESRNGQTDSARHGSLSASSEVQAQQSATDSVRQFAQLFYDWYVPLGDSAPQSKYDSIRVAHANWFTPALLAALTEDVNAQGRTADIVSVVGDYDPFLNSQDACKRFEAREVVPSRNAYAVSIYSVCAGGTQALAVIADVERHDGTWAFANFRIPDQPKYDLVSAFRAARAQRDSARLHSPRPQRSRP